jgi:hypothetical protein
LSLGLSLKIEQRSEKLVKLRVFEPLTCIDAACRSADARAGVSSACPTRMPAPSRTCRTGAAGGRICDENGAASLVTSPATATARFTFLDPAAAGFYPDWDAVAGQNVATLRAEVGRNPYDKALSDLMGELSTRGDTFRQRWARHEVRRHRAGAKRLNHPLVGW